MTNQSTQVAIIMGSDSDLPIVEAIFPILESFGVKYTKNVMSSCCGNGCTFSWSCCGTFN